MNGNKYNKSISISIVLNLINVKSANLYREGIKSHVFAPGPVRNLKEYGWLNHIQLQITDKTTTTKIEHIKVIRIFHGIYNAVLL